MITACIFDLDGVIVDTAHYHYLAWQRLGKEYGYELTLADNERLKGVSRMQSLEILLELANVTLTDHEKETQANRKNVWFVDYIERMLPEEIFPGVEPLIQSLKKQGIKVALASSSKNAWTVIHRLGIDGLFDTVVDGTMIKHTKPDPEIFLLAAQRLEVIPGNCLVFEDAEAGVESALAAGMKCIGIGSPDQLGKADKVMDKTSDFTLSMLNEF